METAVSREKDVIETLGSTSSLLTGERATSQVMMALASGSRFGEELARRKTEELMMLWLSREETMAEVEEWLKLASEGVVDVSPVVAELLGGDRKWSPRNSKSSPPERPRKWFSTPTEEALPSLRRRSMSMANEEEAIASRWREVAEGDGPLPLMRFAPLAAEVCRLPAIVGPLIYEKTRSEGGTTLTDFLDYWRRSLKKPKKRQDRLFAILAKEGANCITKDDWNPLINFVVSTHPGLAFLENHAEFQLKYAQTVVTRIYYRVNLSRTGRISKRELAKADPCVVDALFKLEATDDINCETCYFSYEHFYVLFCNFWELDNDKDGILRRTDLLKYGGHRLSRAIVDRVFSAAPRPFVDGGCASSGREDGLSYGDFVYFMLAEEDKATEASMGYWFACVDIDGDGVIDAKDARHFYDVQAQRMACLGHDVVPLQDVLCQMADLLHVNAPTLRLTLGHFLKPEKIRLAGSFFDALFSLDKFVAFEQRDPFAERLKRDDPFDSDWDRFAAAEYARLAADDDDATRPADDAVC